jgi:hypothetical protein
MHSFCMPHQVLLLCIISGYRLCLGPNATHLPAQRVQPMVASLLRLLYVTPNLSGVYPYDYRQYRGQKNKMRPTSPRPRAAQRGPTDVAPPPARAAHTPPHNPQPSSPGLGDKHDCHQFHPNGTWFGQINNEGLSSGHDMSARFDIWCSATRSIKARETCAQAYLRLAVSITKAPRNRTLTGRDASGGAVQPISRI